MHKILSIVIPVYNVEKYIVQCLDSLIISDELMGLLEVIIVNDGTPDNSAVIAKDYVDRFPDSFKLINKENGGHGSAWNRGLKEATGKYIKFLDSDDWLTNLEQFVKELGNIDADLIYTNINKFYEDKGTNLVTDPLEIEEKIVHPISKFTYYHFILKGFWYWTYNTKMLRKYEPLFEEKVFYDDAILFVAPFIQGRNFSFVNLVLYNYRLGRPGQTMSAEAKKKHAADYTKVSLALTKFVDEHIDECLPECRNNILHDFNLYIFGCYESFLLLKYDEFCKVVNPWLAEMKKSKHFKPNRIITVYDNRKNRLGNLMSKCLYGFLKSDFYMMIVRILKK